MQINSVSPIAVFKKAMTKLAQRHRRCYM